MLKRYRLVSIVATLLFCAVALFYFSSATAEAASSSTGGTNPPKPPTVNTNQPTLPKTSTNQPTPPKTNTNQPKSPTTGANPPKPPAGKPNPPQPPRNNDQDKAHTQSCPATVKFWSTGNTVKLLQQRLKDRGYTDANRHALQVNGKFGYETLFALKHFEADHHLSQDGIAGPNVWRALGIACR